MSEELLWLDNSATVVILYCDTSYVFFAFGDSI